MSPLTKKERIELRKQEIGSKHDRKLTRYSDSFNEIFTFFLSSYRKGSLTFCGSHVRVEFNIDSGEAKNTFRKFDNGDFKGKDIVSRHPNIVKGVIIGKKAWGLWVGQWSDGICEGTFRMKDILQDFEDKGITIPNSLMNDFYNQIEKKINKKLAQYNN